MPADGKTDKEIRESIGSRIQEIRTKLKQTARRVAEELGVSRVTLTQIERGQNNVNAVTLWKLACLFNCEIADFMPTIPKGYGLSRVDLDLLRRENERSVGWAKRLFPNRK